MLALGMNDALDSSTTRFRAASGAPRSAVLLSVYRRALPQAVSVFGMLFGISIGGAVVLESLFSLGGLGQLSVDVVNSTDFVTLRAVLIVAAIASLVVYLIVDMVNMWLDPRRRPGTAGGA